MRIHAATLAAIGVFAFATLATYTPGNAAEPCCSITAIDAKAQTVTARETKTGRAFQFKVADARLLTSLKVGQAVSANFTTMKVSVQPDAQEPCCNIVNLRPAATPTR